jgi:hypothetical protein
MPTSPIPKNLGISRQLSLTVVAVGVCLTVIAIVGGVVFGRVDGAVIAVLVGQLGLLLPAIAGSVKATESADTASKSHQLTVLTASQNASLQQMMLAHCGELCPLDSCPLRVKQEV